MRYTNILSRFLLNISLGVQLLFAVLSVVIFFGLFFWMPVVNGDIVLLLIPVTLVAWMFRRSGAILCVFFMAIVLWLYYCIRRASLLLPLHAIIYFAIGIVSFLLIGLLVSSQRNSLDIAEMARFQLLRMNEQQQKLSEIKDQFLQNVNHELRTPLTAIYGYLELLLEHEAILDEETRSTFLQHAMQSCDELQLLVNNVLDSMGVEKERPHLYMEELAVLDNVYEVLARFDPQSVQKHSITVDIDDYIVVYANAQYLRQIIRNLLSNAFKYAPAGTPITISASLYGKVVDPRHATPEICISIQDAGPGIPPADIDLLFGQFVRLRRDMTGHIRGSGLGLFLCKQFVTAMGGRIWIKSDGIPGNGSCFCFTLPCVVHPKVRPQVTQEDLAAYRCPSFLSAQN
ncbi:MAG TPA: HAMP domain-containing sensor histidine kinase [Dictyobacter sp.]|nr:HAMP domain-containing sensor histidine kinase [Dictyobacter sp.]